MQAVSALLSNCIVGNAGASEENTLNKNDAPAASVLISF